MAFLSQPLIRELLCNAASGSALWARVGHIIYEAIDKEFK